MSSITSSMSKVPGLLSQKLRFCCRQYSSTFSEVVLSSARFTPMVTFCCIPAPCENCAAMGVVSSTVAMRSVVILKWFMVEGVDTLCKCMLPLF